MFIRAGTAVMLTPMHLMLKMTRMSTHKSVIYFKKMLLKLGNKYFTGVKKPKSLTRIFFIQVEQ